MAEPGYLIFSSRIREIYSSLTRKERTIADYMLDHPEQIPNATAGEIGAATASSAATVVRFCRSCGFNGLPELKLALSRADREPELRPEHGAHPRDKAGLIRRRVLDYHNTVINAMLFDWDPDAYDAAADAILKARRVLLLGEGGSRSSCLNLFYTLLSMGIPCEVYMDSVYEIMKVNSLGEGDLVIAITYTGRIRTTVESLQLAKSRGVRTVCLIGVPDSPAMEYVDIALNTTGTCRNYQDSEISVRISESIVIEILSALLAASGELPAAGRLEDPAVSRRRIDKTAI